MSQFASVVRKIFGMAGQASQQINTAKSKIKKDLDTTVETKVQPGVRVKYNFDFFNDGINTYKRLIRLQRIMIILIILLMPFYLSTHKRDNRFFPTTSEGRVVPNVELYEPNIGEPNLVSWLTNAATKSFNMGFHDYNRRLRESSQYYTRRGWSEFTEFLNQEKFFRALKGNNALITAYPQIAPIIQNQGVETLPDGERRYFWELKLVIQVIYLAGGNPGKNYDITVTVVRVPKLENGIGISIDKWQVTRAR